MQVRMMSAVASEAPKKRVLVPIAEGSEEIETTCITDVLVRAGAEVVVASANPSAGGLTVTMSRGIRIMADAHMSACVGQLWDAVVCPGGMPGAKHLAASADLDAVLAAQDGARKTVAAVCASPAVVLKPKGILDGRLATCYPAPPFLEALGDALTPGTDVVVDGHVITSRGPGSEEESTRPEESELSRTSLKFALKIVDVLYGPEKAAELKAQMLVAD